MTIEHLRTHEFHSSEPDQISDFIGSIYAGNVLCPRRAEKNGVSIVGTHWRGIGIYDAAMEMPHSFRTEQPRPNYLFLTCTRGGVTYSHASSAIQCTPGSVIPISATDTSTCSTGDGGFDHISVVLNALDLNDFAGRWLGRELQAPVHFELNPFGAEVSNQWTKLVGCLRGLMQVSPVPELPIQTLYEYMLKLVITGHKSNISHWLLPDDLAAEKDVYAAISMIELDPMRWKTLSSVAYALGCAIGPLENAILRHTRRTSQALLLESRLHGLHMTLSKGRDHTFTEAFRKYGFRLSSQFLVAYRQRFGELPSATYRKNINAVEMDTNTHDPLSPTAIDNFIDSHLIDGPSLADLARHFGLSESSTIAFFKAQLSRTPIQYVIERRLERARWMLCNTTESILTIALECGFGGQSYLATQIKRCYGVTPRQLRASHRLPQETIEVPTLESGDPIAS